MDLLIEKIDQLKTDAERLKQTCRCRSADPQTPRSSKRARRGDVNGGPLQNGLSSSLTTNLRGCKKEEQLDFEGTGDGDWVSAFKAEAGPWTGRPLVVLSLFDGLGGIWQALTNLGIPFSGYSSEVLAPAIQVVKTRHPLVKHVGDIRKLNLSAIHEKVDLVVGGFPCQDLSIMGKKEGLHGRRSKLFFDLLRVLQIFKPKWFLVENVASMSWVDREEITRHLKVPPMELDSQEITASKRRRLYWTNIPHPPRLPRLRDHPSTSLQSCLEGALALEQKCGVVLCSNLYKGSTARLELVLETESKKLRYIKLNEIEVLMGYPRDYTNVVVRETKKKTDEEQVVRSPAARSPAARSPAAKSPAVRSAAARSAAARSAAGRSAAVRSAAVRSAAVRSPAVRSPAVRAPAVRSAVKTKPIVPKASPVHSPSTRQLRMNRISRTFFEPQVWETKSTRQESLKDQDRWFLLGNTFSVRVITYLTSPLLKSSIRSQGKPVSIAGSVKEEELSAMEPGDVWALFNENGRPNWYAVIQSRTGDRFSAIPDAHRKRNVTKLPLKIEMQYLEMTPSYLEDEVDEWNPQRGCGLLKLRQVADVQDSWLAFSHRVTSFVKCKDSYFVYPGNDEVWAVYHAETWSRYYVYVVGSTISCEKLEADKPGKEGFFARCLVLQKTTEHEIYLKTTREVEFTDIQPFCFRVPFHLKHEANLLKVEVSGAKSRKSMGADRESTPGYRRKGKKGQDASDDDDDLIDDGADDDGAEENDDGDGVIAEEMLAGDVAMEMMTSGGLKRIDSDTLPANGGTRYSPPELIELGSGQGSGGSTLET